ncbi:MAG: Nre family DNA repair protein [Candidatus ainarchaeum sp.]|nr:Nre family DNA repair protein [Candidatus ainarchaeum sp.]
MISPELCVKCKGKLLCGLKKCPILEKNFSSSKIISKIKNNSFFGATPPGFFVSWQNYPNVAVAPLSALPEEISPISDKPEEWFGLSQEKIISFRESLLRSYKTIPVSFASNPNYELLDFQEIAMSESLIDIDVSLKKIPKQETKFDSFSAPMGPSAELEKLSFTENISIPKKVDYFFSDTDAKSNTALIELFKNGFPVSFLAKVLSSGALGVKKDRKIVPTRWSITAVDSNISKHFIENNLSQNKIIDSFRLFHSNYLDNDFWVLLLPFAWSFEQIEVWLPGGVWTSSSKEFQILSDCELNNGLKGYPKETEGAYFASRLAITEYLSEKKECAAAIVFREIGKDYVIPLGVWQIRENVRHALQEKPIIFSNIDIVLEFLSKKLKVPINQYKKKSALINHFKTQTRLSQWF